jgi:hypothetical protein
MESSPILPRQALRQTVHRLSLFELRCPARVSRPLPLSFGVAVVIAELAQFPVGRRGRR